MASSLAQRVHAHLAEHPLSELHKLRALCRSWRDETAVPVIPPQSTTPCTGSTAKNTDGNQMLSTLSKLYINEGKRSGSWRTTSTLDIERAVRDFFELMGDMPAASFDVTQARLFKERLSKCPQYFGLRPEFEGLTLSQVIESAKTYKTITAVTINNRLRKLSAFFNWCKINSYVQDNPLIGLKAMAAPAKDARSSFEPDDLCKLLHLKTLQGEAHKYPWRYWIPLLGRTTGARLEELCQLHVDDVTTVQSIPCIRIDDSREGQQLKNASSRRLLPIHPELLALGLLDYVETVKANGSTRLFPELQPTRGKLGHAPSKWFGRYKTKLGIIDSRKTFHSFRHTFIDDLRDAGTQDSLIKRIVGHEDSSVTFGVYGSRVPVKAMLSAIRCLHLHKPPAAPRIDSQCQTNVDIEDENP